MSWVFKPILFEEHGKEVQVITSSCVLWTVRMEQLSATLYRECSPTGIVYTMPGLLPSILLGRLAEQIHGVCWAGVY